MNGVMRCAVVGGGAWGTAIANLLARNGWPTMLWARELDVDFVVLSATSSWLAEGIKDGVMEQLVADPPCDLLLVTGEQPLIR